MREKLIELLINMPDLMMGAEELADHLIANGVTVQEKKRFLLKENGDLIPLDQTWIPVSERLPEKDKEVLCLTDTGSYWLAMFNRCDDGLWSDGEFWSSEKCVTHWMPLPEPPKEE